VWNDVKRALRTKQRTHPSGETFLFTCPGLCGGLAVSPLQCPRTSCLPSCPEALTVDVAWKCGQGARRKRRGRKLFPPLQFWLLLARTRPAGPPPSCGPDKQQNERLSNAFIYTLNTHTHAHKIACSHAMAGTQGKRCPSLFAPSFWVMMPFAGAASSLSFFPCL